MVSSAAYAHFEDDSVEDRDSYPSCSKPLRMDCVTTMGALQVFRVFYKERVRVQRNDIMFRQDGIQGGKMKRKQILNLFKQIYKTRII